jgi:hypothetical protein
VFQHFNYLTSQRTFLSGLRRLSSYNYTTKTEGKHFWILILEGEFEYALFSTLQALTQAAAKWTAAEDIERLVNSLSVITSLWEYGNVVPPSLFLAFPTDRLSQTCVAADHKETCDTLVELLDLDVKGICAQLVSVEKRMGNREFYTQCETHAQSLLDLLQAVCLLYPIICGIPSIYYLFRFSTTVA